MNVHYADFAARLEPDGEPSNGWSGDYGPMVIAIAYRVNPADRNAFSRRLRDLGSQRKRLGAMFWIHLLDPKDSTRHVEVFMMECSAAKQTPDRFACDLQPDIDRFHLGPEPPAVLQLVKS
jgi:hypothetical protein